MSYHDQYVLATYTEEQRSKAMERFRLIRPYLEGETSLSAIALDSPVSLRTLQRWSQYYRKGGLQALVSKERSDRGSRKISPELVTAIEGLALKKTPPSMTSIHRKVERIALDNEWTVPSYGTVYDIIQSLPSSLKTLGNKGKDTYKENFDLIHRREAQQPNEIWQADHTLLDIWVWDEKRKPARPWLTIIMDDYSRAVAGYFLSFDAPSAIQTSLALHQAIWPKEDSRWRICGIPNIFYTDHGTDFTSTHLEQVSADLRMQLIFSTIGVPRGRGKIERFFQTINQLFLQEQPGYISHSRPSPSPSMTLPDLDRQLREFLIGTYHYRVHGTTVFPPVKRWEAEGFLPQIPNSLEDLDLLLLNVATSRRIHPDGIRFQGFRYESTTLAPYIGEDVTIRYNPRDLAEIRVFFHHQFLCRAICSELAGYEIDIKDVVAARSNRKRNVTRQIKRRYDVLAELSQDPRRRAEKAKAGADSESPKIKLKRYKHE
ncbi:Mu transposase C-terminal domain-containing protein [Virgibacillus salexigens]|uniref:Mu transposase C-terminal domain-containing protein n=1 Tax=Virgibacillus massiliensis TaxID=1462526 RepID=UPI001371619A|nr:Mu transposase C-terminal domain-containing protein [Virgibacillus massiliensis]MYL43879.1 DDE-type integrase/transposase/recombinase [Virgibacillus massiliensis]